MLFSGAVELRRFPQSKTRAKFVTDTLEGGTTSGFAWVVRDGDIVQEYAGHYTTFVPAIPLGNYSRWKALATLNWNLGPWSAAWTLRYVGKYTVGYARLDYKDSACASSYPPGCVLKYGASVYHNVTAGYNIEALNTRVDIGIDNLSDKQPALLYQNNAANGNVDASTFDTIGRFYWVRLTVKF